MYPVPEYTLYSSVESIYSSSSLDTLSFDEDSDNENYMYQLFQDPEGIVFGCRRCSCPIVYEDLLFAEIRNYEGVVIGLVFSTEDVDTWDNIFDRDPINEWRTRVYCSHCGIILSFLFGMFDLNSNYNQMHTIFH